MGQDQSPSLPLVLWLLATAIAMFMATGYETAAMVDGHYIPAGNDSFYHARRILDAAVGERGFYQFDEMIHVPEGSWLNWPWGYDYLLAASLSLALALFPDMEPMAYLAHVPVAWLAVNLGLLTAICRRAGLSAALTAVVLLAFALLPLTQGLHGTGVIDHHFMELSFVLATVWAGLRFFSDGAGRTDALLLGLVLGIAPAFHNGLFILQLPVMLAAGFLWLRRREPDAAMLRTLAGALTLTTLMILLPSEPFRDMQFEFWTLSWFHLHAAVCSSAALLYFSLRPVSALDLALFAVLAAALVTPALTKLLLGTAFLSGDLILLEYVAEVKSPLSRLGEPNGLLWVTSYYSWLFAVIPPLLVYFAWRARHAGAASELYLGVFGIFGLLLLLTQFRLHPFGSWAMLVGGAMLLQDGLSRARLSALAGAAAGLLIVAVAVQPALGHRLFQDRPPGLTRDYAIVQPLFASLARECDARPGAVLSYNDDGHYVRYHTECSVMTNNFLMTPQHERKIREADALLQLSPRQFLESGADIDYLFVRMYGIFQAGPNGPEAAPEAAIRAQNAPLFAALTFDSDVPAEFERVDELRVGDDWPFAYAGVYRIRRGN